MKMSGGVEWALHCCVLLSAATEPVAAAKLAELHDASPTYMAKQLQLLSRAGLVRSAPGQSGGYLLTRPATEITVLDVVEAIDGSQPAFRCTEVRQRGPMAIPAERCDAPARSRRSWNLPTMLGVIPCARSPSAPLLPPSPPPRQANCSIPSRHGCPHEPDPAAPTAGLSRPRQTGRRLAGMKSKKAVNLLRRSRLS